MIASTSRLDVIMPSEISTVREDQSVRELKRELAEAREQQVAIAETLRVIASSPMDRQGVFAVVAASAARVCDADDATIFKIELGALRLVAHFRSNPDFEVEHTVPLVHERVIGRAALERPTIQVADLQ